MKKILAVIGARPQFIKHAPIEIAAKGQFDLVSIHTGQHYDDNMSKIFFDQLNIVEPAYMLETGSAGHGVQTGRMMAEIEPIVQTEQPDFILVYGDTNSTLAGALVGAKLNIPIIHIEAGLRSFNKTMPEEINRVLTDHVSSLLLVPTEGAIENLQREGITQNVYKTGDVMCDMVHIARKEADINTEKAGAYYYATIHRPYNTDRVEQLTGILEGLNGLNHPVKFALHPRTKNKMEAYGLNPEQFENIDFLPPVSYFENIALQAGALAIITDSGGIQKEAYILKRKCITIRPETEWTETLESGWNTLAYDKLDQLSILVEEAPGAYVEGIYGDGKASQEIIGIISSYIESSKI